MQNDEMIWNIINKHYCSFQTTMRKNVSDPLAFCKHPYSVTGLCNRTSCPLANSKYATLREDDGRIYLCMKSVERAHSPKNLWERVLLSRNYSKALSQIDEHLKFHYSQTIIHRNKQRLTKIHQYLIRMRKIELQARAGKKAKMTSVTRKIKQREDRRERKALVAAKLEKEIEAELTDRLVKGTYGDIYNFPEAPYSKALEAAKDAESESETDEVATEAETEIEEEVEYVEDLETDEDDDDDMEDMDYLGDNQWGQFDASDNSNSESDDSDSKSSDDDSKSSKDDKDKKKPARKRGPRIEIEYEEEREDAAPEVAAESNW